MPALALLMLLLAGALFAGSAPCDGDDPPPRSHIDIPEIG